MSKLGAVFLTGVLLAAAPLTIHPAMATPPAVAVPHQIVGSAAWGCREKNDLVDLLFMGLSTSFDSKLATALADGSCVFFSPGESVIIVEDAGHGLVKVERGGGAVPAVYWTARRNLE